jgi:3-oxosteroid 1-dehydrogenase
MVAMTDAYDYECDALIVGSGAAGLAAAVTSSSLGLNTLVIEKTKYYGGTTAYSGGGMWIPNNPVLQGQGMRDTPEAARRYLDAVLALNDDDVSDARRTAFLSEGPKAVALLEKQCRYLRFDWVKDYPDYHPELPGGTTDGRQIQPRAVDTRVLGSAAAQMRRATPMVPQPFGMWIRIDEARDLGTFGTSWKARVLAVRLALRGLVAKLQGKKMAMSGGQMLIAGMRAGLVEHDVPLWLQTSMQSLITGDDGEVVGAVIDREGTPVRVRARLGVVLASGGFERDADMRSTYQQPPTSTRWTLGAPGNAGDGIRAGMELGAAVALMDDSWWGPGLLNPEGGSDFLLTERQAPGGMMVNSAGKRFTNESAPYVNVCHAIYEGAATGVTHVPSWFIVDKTYRNRYKLGRFLPRQRIAASWFEAGVVKRADTIRDLAAQMGVPADNLVQTVERFNSFARTGRDLDFGRGDSAYDRYYGDPSRRPNPCLGPIETGPFFALKVVPGDLGTKGGLLTDEHARVLREGGSVIAGLYAAGNTSAAVMGHEYAGPGATIGPAVTFAYIASQHLAARRDHDIDTPATDAGQD